MARDIIDPNVPLARMDVLEYQKRKDGDIEEDEATAGYYGLAEFNEETNKYEPVDKKAEKETDQYWEDIQQYLRKIPGSLRPCPERPRFANDIDNSHMPARKSSEYDLEHTPGQAFK